MFSLLLLSLLQERKRRGCRGRKEAWLARVEEADLAADNWIKNEREKELKAKMVRWKVWHNV